MRSAPHAFISDISQVAIGDYFRHRAALVSGSSVNREIDVARALWRFADHSKYDIGEMPDWGGMRYAERDNDPRKLQSQKKISCSMRSGRIIILSSNSR